MTYERMAPCPECGALSRLAATGGKCLGCVLTTAPPHPSPARSPWTWAWLGWLLLFLAIEMPAAVRERGEPRGKAWKTLSRHVWRWFPTWPRRVVLATFWIALGAHFVFGASALWLLTAVPLVGVIVYSEFLEGG